MLPTVTCLGAESVPAFTSAGRLARPDGEPAQLEVLGAIERAVQHGPEQEFPVDVTVPGESEPDQVGARITAHAEPFVGKAESRRRRALGLAGGGD